VIFKVFLGRDEKGELLAEQKQRFLAMQQHYQ
jgi:putative heme iron utilization protein